MADAHILYPCWWTYAIIGRDEEDLRLVAGEIAKGLQHRISFSKLSAQKHYASMHVEIWVESQEERDRLFQAFQSDSRVRMVI